MKIGFIGLGTMGAPMAENIVKKHDDTVYVWNRTASKAAPFAGMGAVVCESPADLAAKSDVVITMVSTSADVAEVYEQVLPAIRPGTVCIDMSTIDPAVSNGIAAKAEALRAEFLDVPVVKSVAAARSATLGIYVGGKKEVFEQVKPILAYMGCNIIYLGGHGAGLTMKICHNALVSQIQNGVNETVALAGANGIDPLTFATAVSYGGAGNAYLETKKGVLAEGDYTPAFSMRNMYKDVNLALSLASQCGIEMPGENNVKAVYDRGAAAGLLDEDFAATFKVVKGDI